MSFTDNLTQVDGYDMPLFTPKKHLFKVYNDGGHYIASRVCPLQSYQKPPVHEKEDIDYLFDSLYQNAVGAGYKRTEMVEYIRNGTLKLFPKYPNVDEYVESKIKRAKHNLSVRKKRFKRKADLNEWNYFVTFTYDDKKHTADTFRTKLRKCLSNLHTRRGWRYMGVFEFAPETDRLHFHGLFYIPEYEMVGELTEKRDYSTAQHKMQTYVENDFFKSAFGRNEFDELSKEQLKYGSTKDYILKYIGKTDERIVYSRGIKTEIQKWLTDEDIITEYYDYGTKYILFDKVIDYVKDVLKLHNYKQLSIFTNVCNTRLTI